METELSDALKRIQEERAKLDDLERAYRLVAEHQASLAPEHKTEPAANAGVVAQKEASSPISEPTRRSTPMPAMSKSEMVRDAIKQCEETFDLNDVMRQVKVAGYTLERADVSFALSRFVKSKKLHVVTQGAGKIPSKLSKSPLPQAPDTAPDTAQDTAPDTDYVF